MYLHYALHSLVERLMCEGECVEEHLPMFHVVHLKSDFVRRTADGAIQFKAPTLWTLITPSHNLLRRVVLQIAALNAP